MVGPEADPAGVREARDAADAMHRIVTAGAAFIAFRDPGSHAIVQRLLRASDIRPDKAWLHLDTASRPQAILSEAPRLDAYVVVGHIPVAFGKMSAPGMRVLFKGDPKMRRAYVMVTPGERHPASLQARESAERLADYLLSPAGQAALKSTDTAAGGPWLFPRSEAVVLPENSPL